MDHLRPPVTITQVPLHPHPRDCHVIRFVLPTFLSEGEENYNQDQEGRCQTCKSHQGRSPVLEGHYPSMVVDDGEHRRSADVSLRNALLLTQMNPEPVFLEAPSRRYADRGCSQREADPPWQFAEDRYGLEPTAANIAHLSRAISNGEGELFTLPKGKSGKVKLYKGPSSTTKEVR